MKSVKRLNLEFKPENYQLKLKADSKNMTFEGRVIITGNKINRPTKRLTFHQKGLKIESAKIIYFDKKKGSLNIDVVRINSHKVLNELRLHVAEILFPGRYRIEINYTGKINEQMHGLYACNFKLDGKPEKIIATQLESHYAREILPCIDEPSAKATFDLTLISSTGDTALSNMPIKTQVKGKNLTTTFETTPIMSTYLLAFASGKLIFKEAQSSNKVIVRSYATPHHAAQLDYSLDVATRAIDFFEKYFGVKYPLPKLDMLALPDFSAGAMENWGLITYRESCMLVDPESSNLDTKQFAAIIICHEIAHQWFGNLVTMEWWDDLWLNESFANLMEYRAVDELFPDWNIWEHFVRNELGGALRRDSLPNVQPVKLEVNHPDEINTLFDPSIVYAKGSVLLRMLMYKIGEENFKKGLNKYFLKHSFKNTKGSDLWDTLSEVSGQDLGKFMSYWLTTPGFPVVEIEYTPGSNQAKINQKRLCLGEQNSDNRPWPIPLSSSLKIIPDILDSKSNNFNVNPDGEAVLILNDDCKNYFVGKYANTEHFKSILSSVADNRLSTINKMTLLQNYILLERTAMTSTIDNLRLLLSFQDERDEAVWSSMAAILATTRRLVFSTKAESSMNKLIAELVSPLIDYTGWDYKNEEAVQMTRLRELAINLGAVAELPDIITKGLRKFHGFSHPADLSPDIRGSILYIGSRHGTTDDFQKLFSLYSTNISAEDKEEICQALTATNNKENISQIISLLNTNDIRLQDLATWFTHLINNPYAKEQAWTWLVGNWTTLQQKYGDEPSLDRYPRYVAAAFSYPVELDKYKSYFEPMMAEVSLRRTVQLGIEEIAGRIKWRQKNESEAVNWLLEGGVTGFKAL